MAKNFGDADDGEVAGIHDCIAACLPHALAAHAEEFESGVMTAKGADELPAVHFTRSFSGGDQDAHRGIVMGRRDQTFGGCRKNEPQALKHVPVDGSIGTTEVVPFPCLLPDLGAPSGPGLFSRRRWL
jgi:hypothetical protein